MIKRTLLTWAFAGICASGVFAGDFSDSINQLGGPEKESGADESKIAIKELREAGLEAYEDLIEGLNRELPADAIELARAKKIRQHCVQLLGILADSRATTDLLKHFDENQAADAADPEFAGRCAIALGHVWADKKSDDEREKVIGALSKTAKDRAGSAKIVRWSSLRALAELKTAGVMASELIITAKGEIPEEAVIQQAAIEVIRASETKSAADQLANIWKEQAEGEVKDISKSVGVTAVLALAEFKDIRAVAGLVEILTNNRAFPSEPTLKEEATRLLKVDKDLKNKGIDALKAVFIDDEKATRWGAAASALGDMGADGVTALLAVSSLPVPTGKPENHYSRRVEDNLRSLSSDSALQAFADAYRNAGDNKDLSLKLVEQLLSHRNDIQKSGASVFKEAANDERFEPSKRGQCIAAYSNLMGKDSFEDLKIWVTSKEPLIRAEAVKGMASTVIALSSSTEILKSVLADRNPDFFKARENALGRLKDSTDDDLISVFTDSLDPEIEKSPDVRSRTLLVLTSYRSNAGLSEEDIASHVKKCLVDEDENVRMTAIGVYLPLATNLGNTDDAVKAVETALKDKASSVRKVAYLQVNTVRTDLDSAKVVDAALNEETLDMRKTAVTALSNLDTLPEDKYSEIADLCINVLTAESNNAGAQDIIKMIVARDDSQYFSIKKKSRSAIETLSNNKEFVKIVGWIKVLISIRDRSYTDEIKKLAEQENIQLRRQCVVYVRENGGKSDADWLRSLRDRTDSVAEALKGEIESAIKHLDK